MNTRFSFVAALVSLSALLFASQANAAWGAPTRILQIDQNRSGHLNGVTRVYLEGQTCSAEGGLEYFYIGNADEALRSVALAAFLSGHQVRVETSGSCSIRTLRLQ